MASSTLATGTPDLRNLSFRWIVNPRYDLAWFTGATLVSYAYLYVQFGLGVSAMMAWWAFTCFFDFPHIFSTFLRTYLDREERRTRRRWLLYSLLWFALGPVTILLGVQLGTRFLFEAFIAFWLGWAWWHNLRQHYGFMVLYQRKNGEAAGRENRIDYYCFHYVWIGIFFGFILKNLSFRPIFGFGPEMTAVESGAVTFLSVTVLASATLLLVQPFYRYFRHGTFNVPKFVFLVATLSFPFFLWFSRYGEMLNYLTVSASITIFHNVQYQGIVWFYSQSRYQSLPREESVERFGLPVLLTRNVFVFLAAGILFALICRYTQWLPFGSPFPLTPDSTRLLHVTLGPFTLVELAFAFFVGFAIHHYYVDQVIWRRKKDSNLDEALRMGDRALDPAAR